MLRSTFSDSDAYLDVVADDIRHKLADAARLSESLRLYCPSYLAELQWWTDRFEATEGIPLRLASVGDRE